MIGWLLNIVYLALLAVLAPVLAWRAVMQGKYRRGWHEKLWGQVPRRKTAGRCVWFHAVSVGEVLLLEGLIEDLRRRQPDVDIWISTTTQTGHAVATEKFGGCRVVYFPLDFTWAVRAAVGRVRPDLVVLVELEIWPNFIRAVTDAGIPLVLVNGRLGEKSFRGYRRIRWLMRPLLRRFTTLAVQTEEHRRHLMELGACGRQIQVTGTIKFDGVETKRANRRTAALREAFGFSDEETILVAGSTHAPEEELILESYRELRSEFPDLRLVIAPRHRERFEEVARLIQSRGSCLLRRGQQRRTDFSTRASTDGSEHARIGKSVLREEAAAKPVVLLDTLGELSACWGLADMAFVGGSLTNRGGQNMIEPCAYGAVVLFGPNTWNFRHVVEMLLHAEAAMVVEAGRLTDVIRRCLGDPVSAAAMGARARQLVLSQQGATRQTTELIEAALVPERPQRQRRAA